MRKLYALLAGILISITPTQVRAQNVETTCTADFEKLTLTVSTNPLLASFKAITWHSEQKRPERICWSFGDGRDTCINYSNTYTGLYLVHHLYASPGNYQVCVTITYQGGCTAHKCRGTEIAFPDCKADFERLPPTTTNDPLLTHFRALPWHHANKKPSRICWDFGDGKDTCINYPENYTGPYTVGHRYNQPGNYEVCVVIKYYGGCEASKCRLVHVEHPVTCTANFEKIYRPYSSPLTATFRALPWHINNNKPVRICWRFGDGRDTCIEYGPNYTGPYLVTHHYQQPGQYEVCVDIKYAGGCEAHKCQLVNIQFHHTTNICGGYMTDSLTAPKTYRFKGFAIHNPNDAVLSYTWKFGDGSSATGQQVNHTYQHYGVYEVCLTIQTSRGCVTKICKPLNVEGNSQNLLELSPNPVVNILHVLFFSSYNENVSIKILNANGVIVRNYSRVVTMGANSWDHDLSTLLPGSYTYIVQSPNQSASRIFMKL